MGRLLLQIKDHEGNEFDQWYENEIEINFCPFCGYSPKKNEKISLPEINEKI
jgi:Zn ribbon nucleic-acid-binding protein